MLPRERESPLFECNEMEIRTMLEPPAFSFSLSSCQTRGRKRGGETVRESFEGNKTPRRI